MRNSATAARSTAQRAVYANDEQKANIEASRQALADFGKLTKRIRYRVLPQG